MNNPQNQHTQQTIIDQIIKYILIARKYWYLLVIAIIVSFAIFKYKKKFVYNLYSINTTVLVNNQTSNPERIAGGIIFENRSNLDNEIAKIKSFNYIFKAINKANFRIFYFLDNTYGYDPELYKQCPFEVIEVDCSKNQLSERIYLTIIDNNQFELYLRGQKDKFLYKFGELVEQQSFSFIVNKRVDRFSNNNIGKKYYFIFRDSISLAQELQNAINIKPYSTNSSLLWIWIIDKNIDKNIDFLNALTLVYSEESISNKNQTAQKTIKFIDSQIGQFSDSLKNAEDVLQQFKMLNRSELSNEGKKLYDMLSEFDSQKKQLLIKKQFYEFIYKEINTTNEISFTSPSILGFEDVILERQLEQYTQTLIDLKILNLSVNPSSDIAPNKQKSLELENRKNSIIKHIAEVIKYTQFQIDEANKNISQIEQKLYFLPATERQYLQINRKFALNNEIYTLLLKRRMEASITMASNEPDVMVLDKASYASTQYKGTQGGWSFSKVSIFAIIISIGIIFVLEIMKVRVENISEIENKSTIPILGNISFNYKNTNLPVNEYHSSSITESFRSLRTNLAYYLANKKGNIIIISSMISGEGKSFIAANLASILAISSKKTLLVGFDLRKPRLTDIFPKYKKNYGYVEYFLGNCSFDEIIINTDYENLYLTISGTIPPFPAEILDSDKTKEFLKKCSEDFDFVIVDTPPVGIISDALLLAPLSSVFFYVIRENYSFKSSMKIINEIVNERGIKNAALIYNGFKKHISYGKRYGYGYGYGYYKGDGYYEQDEEEGTNSKMLNRIKKLFRKK